MSIRVTIPPEANRPKIRVTLDGQPITPLQLLAPKAPAPQAEPPPAREMAFWHAEDRIPPPWRYTENDDERSIREQAERDGAWTGL
jgi:hypothetical protein